MIQEIPLYLLAKLLFNFILAYYFNICIYIISFFCFFKRMLNLHYMNTYVRSNLDLVITS